MSVLAPAIVDVRSPATNGAAQIANWLRGIGVRQVRLACGLVMFAYIFSHFFNHALGNVSYASDGNLADVSHLVVAHSRSST